MASLRNSSLVDPSQKVVSVKSIGLALGMPFPLSVRDMLRRRDMSRVKRWGVCIVTLTGTARGTSLEASWLDRVFFDADGVASFFRQMSGGRQFVEWQVFGPVDLMTLEQKRQLDAQGASALIDGFRQAAMMKGIPVNAFDHFMWVIDEGISKDGRSQSDNLVGALTFTPQLAMHEMTHSFGVGFHADRCQFDDYADPFCVMGKGSIARSFQNPRLITPVAIGSSQSEHATSGPGICAPYLYLAGWLDYGANVIGVPVAEIGLNAGFVITTLHANQGAPAPGSRNRVALAIGDIPRSTNDPPQYWVEYRHPSSYDRGVDRPPSAWTPDLPPEGALVLHEVRFSLGRPGREHQQLHSIVIGWVGARQGSILTLPWLGYAVKVADVDASSRQVFLTIEKNY